MRTVQTMQCNICLPRVIVSWFCVSPCRGGPRRLAGRFRRPVTSACHFNPTCGAHRNLLYRCRGWTHGGLRGLVAGLWHGLSGVFLRPLAHLLELAAHQADSMRARLAGPPMLPRTLRPRRHVSALEPLLPYSQSEVRLSSA